MTAIVSSSYIVKHIHKPTVKPFKFVLVWKLKWELVLEKALIFFALCYHTQFISRPQLQHGAKNTLFLPMSAKNCTLFFSSCLATDVALKFPLYLFCQCRFKYFCIIDHASWSFCDILPMVNLVSLWLYNEFQMSMSTNLMGFQFSEPPLTFVYCLDTSVKIHNWFRGFNSAHSLTKEAEYNA